MQKLLIVQSLDHNKIYIGKSNNFFMENEEKYPAFRVYRVRRVLVSVDVAESLVARLPEGFTFDGRRDIYQHKPLEYRTVESLRRTR